MNTFNKNGKSRIGSTHTPFTARAAVLLGSLLLLTACGGGGSQSNAGPVFTSGDSISVPENTTATGYTATATDADGDTVTFSLSGGADQAAFSLDASSGVLSFNTAPNFEAPTDSDGDNGYTVEISASDGNTTTTRAVTVMVTDVAEAPDVAATPALGLALKAFRFTWSDVADATFYRLLENPDGVSGFSQVGGDIPAGDEHYDHSVPLYARVNARYLLQSCNPTGCTDSSELSVSGTLTGAVGYFKASNTGASDWFGWAVALSADGSTLAVGAIFEASNATGIDGDESDNSLAFAGAVYVFTRSAGAWVQQAYVKASNTDAHDRFGTAVTLSADGSTLAVGAHYEDSNATGIGGNESDNSASGSGAVYVFTRSAGAWSQQAYVKASNTDAGDQFGTALALSADGTTLAVGAADESSNATGIGGYEGDNSAGNAGAVYVFTRSAGGAWSQQAYVKASNTDADDRFGYALALSADGTTLAVGAADESSNATGIDGNESDNSAGGSGAVYVFTRSAGGTWSQQAYVKASNTGDAFDHFGWAVALSADGTTLAVGAHGEASNATGIGGNESDNSARGSGAVYVFTRSAGVWVQQAYVKASNTDANERFGTAVALSADGNTLAVGAFLEDSNATGIGGNEIDNLASSAGAVYVFTRSAGAWVQQAYVKASNTDTDDRFGQAVALSADGSTLAVGAYFEDSNTTGIGGDQFNNDASGSGAVYLY